MSLPESEAKRMSVILKQFAESGLTAQQAIDALLPKAQDAPPMEAPTSEEMIARTADSAALLQLVCHGLAKDSGWWRDPATNMPLNVRSKVAEKLLLIHSEVSEATEGFRKDLMDDHLPHRKMLEVELADALIRIADLAGALGLDLGGAVFEKLLYNRNRADHKPSARVKAGGKTF